MGRAMGSTLPSEKLDWRNYASWLYKMHQYLLGHGYWNNVEGTNEAAPNATHRDFPVWEQAASKVMTYYFASNVRDQLLGYIRGTRTLKDAWGNLKRIFAARKLYLLAS